MELSPYLIEDIETVLKEAPTMVHSIDASGRLVYVNRSWLQGLEYEEHLDEVLGRRSIDFLTEESRRRACENLKDFYHTGLAKNLPYQFVARSGKVIDVLLSAISVKDEQGNYLRSLAFIVDISNQSRVQAEIKALNARLRLALEASEIGIWDWNIKQDILVWDEQMFKIYGNASDNFQWKFTDWQSCVHPEDVQPTKELIFKSYDTGCFDAEFRVLAADSSIRHVRALAKVFYDHQGQPECLLGANWDITEKKQFETQLKEAKKSAEAASTEKTLFLARISHEVRGPLTAIMGYTDLLMSDSLQPEERRQCLTKIQNSGQQLKVLVNDVMNLSSIESGKLRIDVSSFQLDKILEETLTSLQIQYPQVEQQVCFNRKGIVRGPIFNDAHRVKQVIFNLLSNSIKFSGKQKVRIETSINGEDKVQVDVIDGGVGIPEEFQDKIFEPFMQVRQPGEKIPGSGLGLHVCKLLCHLLGGDIQLIKSESGQGSHFSFWFSRDLRLK